MRGVGRLYKCEKLFIILRFMAKINCRPSAVSLFRRGFKHFLVPSNANALDDNSYLVMQIATLAMQCAGEAKRKSARIKPLPDF